MTVKMTLQRMTLLAALIGGGGCTASQAVDGPVVPTRDEGVADQRSDPDTGLPEEQPDSADTGGATSDASDAGDVDAAGAVSTTCILGVPQRFQEIPNAVSAAQHLGANNFGVIEYPRYTTAAENLFGIGEHFQGVQRSGRTLIVTGGVKNGARTSQLILIHMGTRSETAAWSLPSYGHDPAAPPAEDHISRVIDIDATLWHAGGAQLHDGTLVVPITGDDDVAQSEIRFFDVRDPAAAVELPTRVVRDGKTYAAALTREPDDTHLLLAWDDQTLDFFRSNSSQLADGFAATPTSVDPNDVSGGFQTGGCGLTGCGNYQSVNFVRDCDGRLFLIGTRNTQKGAPTARGENLAGLYEVTSTPTGATEVTFVALRSFDCADQCSFGAGAGVYVLDQTHLVLYGVSHWLQDAGARYSFVEFVTR